MKVYVNGTLIEIFNGARVMDALLKYSKTDYLAVMRGEKLVTDEHENPNLPDGELTDGQSLIISKVKQEEDGEH